MSKLVIGCGYLGRRVAQEWSRAGDAVWALTRSRDRAAELAAQGLVSVIGDVTRPESLRALPPADTVLYAVGLDRQSGHTQREVYVDGLVNVLRRLETVPSRFVYISSTSVYGEDAGEWVDEETQCRPRSSNGQVCLDAELELR
ncbi:MAG: NAD-dependent epimerase/dehydratase family protein, partial [Planctomycetales bacterium]